MNSSMYQWLLAGVFQFQDLKNYQYHYWFAFPALMPEKPVVASPPVSIKSHFSEDQVNHYIDHIMCYIVCVDQKLSGIMG